MNHSSFHGTSRNQNFRNKYQVVAEFHSDDRHAIEEPVIKQLVGSETISEGFLSKPVDFGVIAHDQFVSHLLHDRGGTVDRFGNMFTFSRTGNELEFSGEAFVRYRH